MNYLNENIESLHKKLKDGEITADQLTQDTLKGIKELEPKLNAMITVVDDAKPAQTKRDIEHRTHTVFIDHAFQFGGIKLNLTVD